MIYCLLLLAAPAIFLSVCRYFLLTSPIRKKMFSISTSISSLSDSTTVVASADHKKKAKTAEDIQQPGDWSDVLLVINGHMMPADVLAARVRDPLSSYARHFRSRVIIGAGASCSYTIAPDPVSREENADPVSREDRSFVGERNPERERPTGEELHVHEQAYDRASKKKFLSSPQNLTTSRADAQHAVAGAGRARAQSRAQQERTFQLPLACPCDEMESDPNRHYRACGLRRADVRGCSARVFLCVAELLERHKSSASDGHGGGGGPPGGFRGVFYQHADSAIQPCALKKKLDLTRHAMFSYPPYSAWKEPTAMFSWENGSDIGRDCLRSGYCTGEELGWLGAAGREGEEIFVQQSLLREEEAGKETKERGSSSLDWLSRVWKAGTDVAYLSRDHSFSIEVFRILGDRGRVSFHEWAWYNAVRWSEAVSGRPVQNLGCATAWPGALSLGFLQAMANQTRPSGVVGGGGGDHASVVGGEEEAGFGGGSEVSCAHKFDLSKIEIRRGVKKMLGQC